MIFATRTLLLAALCCAGTLAWAFWLGQPDWPLDDAYIVQHSVNGLKAGGVDSRFAGSTPLQGATSIVHVLAIAALSSLISVGWAQVIVAALAIFAYLAGNLRLADQAGLAAPWPALLALLGVLSGFNAIHLVNGLETGMAMAAVVWTLVLFRDPLPVHASAFALIGLMPFIRPELGALGALIGLRALWALRGAGHVMPRLGAMIGWGLAGLLPFALVMIVREGTLLPNTVAAKQYFFVGACRPFLDRLTLAATNFGWYIGGMSLTGLALLAVFATRYRWIAAGFLVVFLGAYLMRFPSGLVHNWARYPHILTPFVLVGVIRILTIRGQVFNRPPGQVLVLAALALAVIEFRHPVSLYGQQIAFARQELATVARWVETHVPPDAAILVHDAGYIALHGRQPLVDLVGLKTPSSIPSHRTYTYGSCSHDPRAVDEIARRNGTGYAVLLDDWDQGFAIGSGLASLGWGVTRIDTERGETAYRVYRIEPPK